MNSEKPLVRTGALQLATSLMPRRTLSHLEGFRKAFRAGGAMEQKTIESRSQCRDICRRSRVTQDLRVESTPSSLAVAAGEYLDYLAVERGLARNTIAACTLSPAL